MIARAIFAILLASLSPLSAELLATFQRGDTTDTRVDRLPAFAADQDGFPTPFLASDAYTVTWTGDLVLDKRSRLFFSFSGLGQAKLTIAGEEILSESGQLGASESKRIRLNPGSHPVVISYTPNDDSAAQFQLHWRGRDFPREPVPASAFAPINHDDTIRRGRALFATHNCMKCHHGTQDLPHDGMPELFEPMPQLTNIGSRVTPEWLTRWISSPQHLRPDTTMPALVDHRTPDGAQAAADMAAYLATLQPEAYEPLADKADADTGAQIFHSLGCVACHTTPAVHEHDTEHLRLPLNNVDTKFRDGALRDFLLDPAGESHGSKMPDFQLTEDDASHLAAFLREQSRGHHTPDPSEFPPGDAARGKELVVSQNCTSCHSDLGEPSPPALPLNDIVGDTGGCLATPHDNAAPEHNLTADEKTAIAAYLVASSEENFADHARRTPSEYAQRSLTALRCINCHSHDGSPSVISRTHIESFRLLPESDEADERLDQSLPSLTHAGAKLHSSYISGLLTGTHTERDRPWLDMKMPAFTCDHDLLAQGLAHQHGLPTSEPAKRAAGPNSDIGQKLISPQGGFACITCHAAGDQAAVATFEVAGINFNRTRQRLRTDFYFRWMHDPRRIDEATKMPRYTTPDGNSILAAPFNADSQQQFQAILDYINSL